MQPTILVTGGAGYIGAHACQALARHGFLPITFDNFSQGHKYAVQWGPYVEGDLLNPQSLQDAIRTFKPIAVMHFASLALVGESMQFPENYYRTNVTGTLNLLECCSQNNIKHLIFSSSCATYGGSPTIPISEEFSGKPINPYGKTKLIIEEMLHDFSQAHGLKSICLRYFNAVGADLDGAIGENHTPETHLLPLVIQAALEQTPHISVFGTDFDTVDGSAVRDYIHVQDLAEAHVLSLLWLLEHSTDLVLNLGTGKGYSVLEIIKAVERYTKRLIRIQLKPRRAGDPAILIADNRKAKKILGWEPKCSDLETIIISAWKWQEKMYKNRMESAFL